MDLRLSAVGCQGNFSDCAREFDLARIIIVASNKRRSAVRWGVARNVVLAWVITFPASAAGGAVSYWILSRFLGA